MEQANGNLAACQVEDITPGAQFMLATAATAHYNKRIPQVPPLKVTEILALLEKFQAANPQGPQ